MQRNATVAFFVRRGRYYRKKAPAPDIETPKTTEKKPWGRSDLPIEEQSAWDEFSAEHSELALDEIDVADPGEYMPLPVSWRIGKDQPVEHCRQLLAIAEKIRAERETRYGATVPTGQETSSPYVHSLAEEVLIRTRVQVAQAWEIGKCLHLAKEALRHGQFGPWLQRARISKSSALNAMRLYRVTGGCAELLDGLSATQAYVICGPSFPAEFRQLIFDEKPNDLPKDAKKIAQLGELYRTSPLPLEVPEIKALFEKRAHRIVYKKLERELRSLWQFLDLKINRVEEIAREARPEAFCRTDEESKCCEQVARLLRKLVRRVEQMHGDLDWESKDAEKELPSSSRAQSSRDLMDFVPPREEVMEATDTM